MLTQNQNKFSTLIRKILLENGISFKKGPKMSRYKNIPDLDCYEPMFSPWKQKELQSRFLSLSKDSLVSHDRLYVLINLLRQTNQLHQGEVWECGVYRGGTAKLMQDEIKTLNIAGNNLKTLRLFDTFEGMPETDPHLDLSHSKGDFSDTKFENIICMLSDSNVKIHKGFIPHTFNGLEDAKISFAHIDVDIYSSVKNCCEFIYPKMVNGGIMVFDDYGFPSCPGARKAVDEFFKDKIENPLVLSSGQAIVYITR